MQAQTIAQQDLPRARRPAQWGLLLLGLTLFYTLSLARFFFWNSLGYNLVPAPNDPTPFVAITQGVDTLATITNGGSIRCFDPNEPGKLVGVTVHYQDLQHVTHSFGYLCVASKDTVGDTVTIHYVPGYADVESLQEFYAMEMYYLRLGIIIAAQFLLMIPLIIIVVRTQPKRKAKAASSVAA
jgi:hypothetical protein